MQPVEPGLWRSTVTANELGLWRATDGKLTALANVGPANPREFAEVTSTTDVLRALANATGGDARRLADGDNLDVPRVVPVRTSTTFKGEDWIGLKMRDVSVVRGIGVLPIFAGLIGLLLLVGSLAATWAREGPINGSSSIDNSATCNAFATSPSVVRRTSTIKIEEKKKRQYRASMPKFRGHFPDSDYGLG